MSVWEKKETPVSACGSPRPWRREGLSAGEQRASVGFHDVHLQWSPDEGAPGQERTRSAKAKGFAAAVSHRH